MMRPMMLGLTLLVGVTAMAGGALEMEARWKWTDAPRPVLEAFVGPKGAAKEVRAWIDGQAAEVVSHRDAILRFRPARELKRGVHEVKIEAEGPGGRSATLSGVFCSKAPGCRVSIRDDNVLLVDGKPFFPIGAYRDPSDTLTDFSGLEEAGFNLTHSYFFEDRKDAGIQPPEVARKYLEDAHKHGLKVFMGIHRGKIGSGDFAWCQRWAAELMDCPALLTWYLFDEPAGHGVTLATMQKLGRVVKSVDPFRPHSVVFCVPGRFKRYAACCDLFWTDPYPLPRRPLTMVEEWVKQAVAAAGPSRPVWAVLQAHDLRHWRDPKQSIKKLGNPTQPTPRQTRCMAFMALAAGANGIVYYWGPNSKYHIQKQAPTVWRGVCDTVGELNGLMPFLVARRAPRDAVVVPEPFRTWSREAGGNRVLAVINTAAGPADIALDLSPFGAREVSLRPGRQPVTLENAKLSTSFEPHEVKVYQWPTRR